MTICDICGNDVKKRIQTHGCGSLSKIIHICKICYKRMNICFVSYEDCVINLKEMNAEHLIPFLNKD